MTLLDDLALAHRKVEVRRLGVTLRLALAGHVASKTWLARSADRSLRRALLHLGFMETALWTFGQSGMFNAGGGFYPLYLLPDFHGPYFDEALLRLLVPGRGPFVVNFGVTGVCPCRCTYCYASAGGANAPEVDEALLLEAARSLARTRVPLVMLGGGEPLTRFERVVKLIDILAPNTEVRLLTSGFGMTLARAKQLREAGLSVVAVSLDSDDRRTVNTRRGHDRAFDEATRALECASQAGLTSFVTCVVDEASFRSAAEVARFLAFVRSIDPEIVVNFMPQFAAGRASGGFRHPADYAPVARLIAGAIRSGEQRATVFLGPVEYLMGCVGGGRRQLNIDIHGNLTACISAAGFGNLRDEPFDAIYARFVDGDARLKRGFFCASIAEQAGSRTLDPDASNRALSTFHEAHEDTHLQRLIDRAGGLLTWLAKA